MKKSNFYKEWIKTRRYFPIALTVSVIFIIYALLGVQRVINFRGVAHLWEILLSRDVVFIETFDLYPPIGRTLACHCPICTRNAAKTVKADSASSISSKPDANADADCRSE